MAAVTLHKQTSTFSSASPLFPSIHTPANYIIQCTPVMHRNLHMELYKYCKANNRLRAILLGGRNIEIPSYYINNSH